MTREEKKKLKPLQKILRYSFRNHALLKRALTHKSFAHEKKMPPEEQNERLEFLGDAVLELAVSELLIKRYPNSSEGFLSKTRAAIVNEKQLASLARELGVGEHLYLGRGEEQTGGREKNSLLADAYEAILGAVYLDRGFHKASSLIQYHYGKLLDHKEQTPQENFFQDYKTELQEKAQSRFRSVPRYRLVGEHGPDHDKRFDVEIYIQNDLMGRGMGRNKKDAEQEAAKQALEKMASSIFALAPE